MQIYRAALLLTMLSGCAAEQASDPVLASALKKPVEQLAQSHAGDDISAMRASARNVIATYDAAVGRSASY